ncbi:ParB/RepB/Spo0J family partition protein [Methylobacterium gnaphalii]|uniref:Chromosome partitioning protein ParB n=1 Tax=Methylobacterium gnaphalii TaxID=1010610 RepID=A0A512JIU7_9HYPH|nr:ParB/RepB/Spo0J family partition protein [Methylobacterium gnaphalii]GEP09880.1 chromosome partitioning protein ParB [Methylobacterium gnaphalii]GJD67204.1 Nucleoid occlusion protein [Methylobacterium gnaphalii]GLS49909.1 chromosome partitioning protein ParB [Methylobacterium gnaphalii]
MKPQPASYLFAATQAVPLDLLDFGHGETGVSVNARTMGQDEAIDELAASILAHGLIQPLVVRRTEGDELRFTVIAGNRRLAALQKLAAAGKLPEPNPLIDVVARDLADGEALEVSLAENLNRLPLHPVDQYEVFARLGTGKNAISEAAIATRFGMPRKEVKQRLALGRLAPEILDAWRKGKIHAETAQAFTLARDVEHQLEVFRRLGKEGGVYPYRVREEFSKTFASASGKLVEFVGLDAYKAAGGTVRTDLFSDRKDLANPEIIARLVQEKTESLVDELKAEGWSWVALADDVSMDHYLWPKITPGEMQFTKGEKADLAENEARLRESSCIGDERLRITAECREIEQAAEARAYADDDRARAGAIIDIGWGGKVTIRRGVLKPGAKASAGEPAPAVEEGPKPLSQTLAHTLSCQLSDALAGSLATDPDLALSVMLATFLTHSGSPCIVRHSGRAAGPLKERVAELQLGKFPEVLQTVRDMPQDDRLELLAAVAGAAIDASSTAFGAMSSVAKGVDAASVSAVFAAIDPDEVRHQVGEQFDAVAYFAGASKAHAIAALTEIHGRNTCTSTKKGDIAALAEIEATKHGWLPTELRTVHYTGPGAAKPKAKRGSKRSAAALQEAA